MRSLNLKRALRSLTGVFAALILALTLVPSVAAFADTTVNDKVLAARDGVLQVNMVYRDDANEEHRICYGSGFLINSNTIVTCAHVVDIDLEVLEFLQETYGKSEAEVKDRISYSVTINRDVTVPATVRTESQEVDWAVLVLQDSIQGREVLSLRHSSEVAQTESVYAIGFPDESHVVQDINTYTSADATITQGVVNKVATGTNLYSGANTEYIQTSVKLTEGNSGGPMVDADGYVIGICEGSTGTFTQDDYFYAIAVDQLIDTLNPLGIQYTLAGESLVVAPEEPAGDEPDVIAPAPSADKSLLQALVAECGALDAKEYSADSYAELSSALNDAASVLNDPDASQQAVDAAVQTLNSVKGDLAPAGPNVLMIVIIVIAVFVVLAIVAVVLVIVLVSNAKKKKAAAAKKAQAGPRTTPVQPVKPAAPQAPAAPQQTAPMSTAGETTVLSGGAGETTVLSSNMTPAGTLTNKKSGEKVTISGAEFVIGREPSRVNYCIKTNTTVGRVHAKIVTRNGQSYLVDLKATNGTFLNGVKCAPNQEYPLKSGDKVTLSDEEFTYQA